MFDEQEEKKMCFRVIAITIAALAVLAFACGYMLYDQDAFNFWPWAPEPYSEPTIIQRSAP